LKIELLGITSKPLQQTRVVEGGFEFHGMPPGTYQFQVSDGSRRILLRHSEQLNGTNDRIVLRLPFPQSGSRTNTMSLRTLVHRVPKKALEAFRAGIRATQCGDVAASIEHFQKAASMDPQFAEAETNLSIEYLRSGRLDEGIVHAQKAYQADPNLLESGHSLATSLLEAQRFQEAETVLRAMLRNWPDFDELHGLLAVSLFGQERRNTEAMAHLNLAVAEFPVARLLCARVLVRLGELDLAVKQVQEYMQAIASECERQVLERWIVATRAGRIDIAAAP